MKKLFRKLCGKMTPTEVICNPQVKCARLTVYLSNGDHVYIEIESNDIINGKPEKEFEKVLDWFNRLNSYHQYTIVVKNVTYVIVKDSVTMLTVRTFTSHKY